MASLTDLSLNGNPITATSIYQSGAGLSPWVRLYHCADATDTSVCNPTYSCGWLHVRTPIPIINTSYSFIFEIVGFHTYDGGYTHDNKTSIVLYSDGSVNANVRVNSGNAVDPWFYPSNNTYGGYKRLCVSMQKVGCCCVGWVWFRWGPLMDSYWNDYAWATLGGAYQTISYF